MLSPGTEIRFTDTVDFVAEVPVYIRTAGVTSREEWGGIDTGLVLEPVPGVAMTGFALQLGIQVRLFGANSSNSALGDYVD